MAARTKQTLSHAFMPSPNKDHCRELSGSGSMSRRRNCQSLKGRTPGLTSWLPREGGRETENRPSRSEPLPRPELLLQFPPAEAENGWLTWLPQPGKIIRREKEIKSWEHWRGHDLKVLFLELTTVAPLAFRASESSVGPLQTPPTSWSHSAFCFIPKATSQFLEFPVKLLLNLNDSCLPYSKPTQLKYIL